MFFKRSLITLTIVVIAVWVKPANAATKNTENIRSHCESFLMYSAGFPNDNTAIEKINEYKNAIENNLNSEAKYKSLSKKLEDIRKLSGYLYNVELSNGPKMTKAVNFIAEDFTKYLQNDGKEDSQPVTSFVDSKIYDGDYSYVKEMFDCTLQ